MSFSNVAVVLCLLSLLGCKRIMTNPNLERGSTVYGTSNDDGTNGQVARCGTILPNMDKVLTPLLKKIVQYNKDYPDVAGSEVEKRASKVAKHTVQMLRNLMRSPDEPIHPLAFFAMVKDFESSTNTNWGQGGVHNAFRTGNCLSGECYGLFQVDVLTEGSAWGGGSFCQSGGLNIWNTYGGPDTCAALFWWTLGENGTKCDRVTNGGANPCTQPNYSWTLENVNDARWAYQQAAQPGWGAEGWKLKYKSYKRCLVGNSQWYQMYATKVPGRSELAPQSIRESVNAYKEIIGLQ